MTEGDKGQRGGRAGLGHLSRGTVRTLIPQMWWPPFREVETATLTMHYALLPKFLGPCAGDAWTLSMTLVPAHLPYGVCPSSTFSYPL